MKKGMKSAFAATLALTACFGGISTYAAFDENLNVYTLDAVVVEADKTKNKFGDTVTEQSYYRTGGDVKVITREEIEKRHYTDVTEAIKRVPGVTFTNAGYRGGQYGYNSYNNSMAINGDSRVIVLIDGRRVDNAASYRFGASNAAGGRTMVDLNQLIGMEDVDKIEVIKGPGASVYGADATGGVINIITRKGTDHVAGALDLSTGSWGHHVYSVNVSGATDQKEPMRYFISASRNMSGDSKYRDGITGENHTYNGTSYKEDSVNVRLDKELGGDKNLKIWYNHKNGKDGYPITARDWRYWNEADWNRIIERTTRPGGFGNTDNPGYRNLFSLDALSGSYNAYKSNDIDVVYTFKKDNGMDSFVRVYSQHHDYWGIDRYPSWILDDGSYVPFPGSAAWSNFIKNYHPAGWDDLTDKEVEKNHGIQLQLGKSFGRHDVLGSVTYDKSVMKLLNDYGPVENTEYRRNTLTGYVQDKIHVNDKWDVTPALRYSHYNSFSGTRQAKRDSSGKIVKDGSGNVVYVDSKHRGDVSTFTPVINTEYMFSDDFSAYAGWTKIYRPIKGKDYATDAYGGGALKDEKGDVWTIGLRKGIGPNTEVTVHYDWTKMSNAITQYSVDDPSIPGHRLTRYVNAKEDKQSFNITVDHKFNNHWNLGLAYTHFKDTYRAKDGVQYTDVGLGELSNVNTQINKLRPANHFTMNLSYENNKFYSGLLVNWYTGMDTTAYTDNQFLVLDWNMNYELRKNINLYLSVTNLTNESYENAYSEYNGLGAAPQPGRAWMVGARYKF